jgi:hypothetical protein
VDEFSVLGDDANVGTGDEEIDPPVSVGRAKVMWRIASSWGWSRSRCVTRLSGLRSTSANDRE